MTKDIEAIDAAEKWLNDEDNLGVDNFTLYKNPCPTKVRDALKSALETANRVKGIDWEGMRKETSPALEDRNSFNHGYNQALDDIKAIIEGEK